jgi:hypothetical protein
LDRGSEHAVEEAIGVARAGKEARFLARLKDVHGNGEVKNHERGHIADSLKLNEHDFRALVSCTLTKEAFCQKVTGA